MVLNLNILDLITTYYIMKKNTLYKIFFIISLNHLQFHYVQNSSDKNYTFHDFLSVQ